MKQRSSGLERFWANNVSFWWVCVWACVCVDVCVWVWDNVCTADCAGFYCSPWWAQRGSLVNVVQFKVKTNKIGYLSVVRFSKLQLSGWVHKKVNTARLASEWVQEDVSQEKGWCKSARDSPQTHNISTRELVLLLGNLLHWLCLITVISSQK